jgi:hypothetical protein
VADQELKWWHVRWRLAGRAISRVAIFSGKVFGLLCLVAAIGYGVLYFITPWLVSQRICKVDPRLSLVPTDLPTKAEVPLSNATIVRYGFRISLPNEEIAKTIQGDFISMVSFRNGGFLTIHNPSRDSGVLDIMIGDKHVERFIGQKGIQSKFKLTQAAMWTTPEHAKWWKFHTLENERVEYLLLTKFSILANSTSLHAFTLGPIYAISAGGFRGFQIGDPEVPPYEAHVDLFDGSDRHLALDVSGPKRHAQVLSQAEINAIVASIRPASDR